MYGCDQRVVSTRLFFSFSYVFFCFTVHGYIRCISAACLTTVPSAFQYLGTTRILKWEGCARQWSWPILRLWHGRFSGGTGEKKKKEFRESGSLNSNSALLSILPVQPCVLFSCRFLSLFQSSVSFRSLLYLPRSFNLKTIHRILTVGIFWGHAIAQLVEALRYKSEGRRFDSRWCHWNFSLT